MSDACASAAAMTTRCFSPPLSVLNRRCSSSPVPVARERIARDGEIARPFELEQPEMRMPAHQHHLEHGVLEGELRLLRHHRNPLSDRRAATAGRAAHRRAAPSQRVGRRVPLSSRSSVVLPDPFGPEDADDAAAGDVGGDVVETPGRSPPSIANGAAARCGAIPERDLIGPQQRALPQTRCGRAQDSRAPLRTVWSNRFSTRAKTSTPRTTRNDAAEVDDACRPGFS